MSKFKKFGGKVSFTVDGEDLEFDRLKTEKLQDVLNFARDEDNIIVNIVGFFVEEIKKNYPEEAVDDVLAFVQKNAMKLYEEFQIAYGFISREELEKAKAKGLDKIVEDKNAKAK